MAASLSEIRLVDALVLVGPNKARLDGFGDDLFSLAPGADEGSMQLGAQGDAMLVSRVMNGYVMTLTFFTASVGITTILDLHSTLRVWEIAISYGDFNMTGWASLMNRGELAASLGNNIRTMTLNIVNVAGNINAAPGRIVSSNLPQ